jgi:cysteine desulfurase
MNNHKSLYLDNQATTPMDPKVIELVYDVMKNVYGNPHSRSHQFGWNAEEIIEKARLQIANVINASTSEIIFTSGATESNNIAIKGVWEFLPEKNHIITSSIEHKCLLESCRYLEGKGVEITYIKPDKDGLIDPQEIKSAIKPNTLMVSIIAVHNEIGTIQDMKAIGQITKEAGIYFHSDCAQAFGKIPLDVEECNVDLMSISGHKIYGPKGIGALYIRKKPRVRIKPLIHGGGQERGMRSGTLAAPIIAGFGLAAQICQETMHDEHKRLSQLSAKLIDAITLKHKDVFLNGSREKRYPGNVNLSFSYIEGESFLMGLKGIAVSSGSACTSASLEPSYVLKSLGLSDELASSSIRFGLGRFTTEEDVDYTIETVNNLVTKLREMSPLWEMVQNGVDLSKVKWTEH